MADTSLSSADLKETRRLSVLVVRQIAIVVIKVERRSEGPRVERNERCLFLHDVDQLLRLSQCLRLQHLPVPLRCSYVESCLCVATVIAFVKRMIAARKLNLIWATCGAGSHYIRWTAPPNCIGLLGTFRALELD